MHYDFESDIRQTKSNFHKHSISFERASTIFRDPNVLSIPDDEHNESEERRLTIGLDENGLLLVISHRFRNLIVSVFRIRMNSARKATRAEKEQYEEEI